MAGLLVWIPAAVVLSGLIAGVVLWALLRFFRRGDTAPEGRAPIASNRFLVRDGAIVDHDAWPHAGFATWAELRGWLGAGFGDLPVELARLRGQEVRRFAAREPGEGARVEIATVGGGHRVTLVDPDPSGPVARHEARRQLAALEVFRHAAETAPHAICALDASGQVSWCNARFRALPRAAEEGLLIAAASRAPGAPVTIEGADDGTRHFDLTAAPHDGGQVIHARDVTRQTQAETMRGSFIQTLTKTFADLATGLAVFDRERRLVLFNPAMIDLTGLSAEFLSARPGLVEFFDRLRERRVLPEPRDYTSWRAQIGEMIETAAGGHYSEAWSLPGGLTYRVTGRPHPDGAIAFLVEDISDEIALSRRSRAQLELRQAVLDRMADAVAVVGPDGQMTFCNRAFRDVLGVDPQGGFAETGLEDLLRLCRARFPDEAFWAEIEAASGRARLERRLASGPDGIVEARCEPLQGGYCLLTLAAVAGVPRIPA